MLTYCLKCKKDAESVVSKFSKTENGRTILSKFVVFGSKKLKFIKEKEAKGLLSSLGIKTQSNKVPLLGNIFVKSIK